MGNFIVELGSSFCTSHSGSKYPWPFDLSWVTRFVPVTSGQHFQDRWACYRSLGSNFWSVATFAEPFTRHGSTWLAFSYLPELAKFSSIFGSSKGHMCLRFSTSRRNFQISTFAETIGLAELGAVSYLTQLVKAFLTSGPVRAGRTHGKLDSSPVPKMPYFSELVKIWTIHPLDHP